MGEGLANIWFSTYIGGVIINIKLMLSNDVIATRFLSFLNDELLKVGFTQEEIERAGLGLRITDNTGDGFIGAVVTQTFASDLPEMHIGFDISEEGSVISDKDLSLGGLTDAGNRGLMPIPTFIAALAETMKAYNLGKVR